MAHRHGTSMLEAARQRCRGSQLIVVYTGLAPILGSFHAAALVSRLLYWTDRAANAEGWIYKTRAQWHDELGLSVTQLDTARRLLRAHAVIEESYHLAGSRRVLHMRLCMDRLLQMIDTFPSSAATDASPASRARRGDTTASIPVAGACSPHRTDAGTRPATSVSLRSLIPGLQVEPVPGSSAWRRAVRLLPTSADEAGEPEQPPPAAAEARS